MGCVSNKLARGKSTDNEKDDAEQQPQKYRSDKETLRDVKDFQFVEFDVRLPLTKKQIFCLLQSWRGISRDLCSTGMEMLVKLILADSKVQKSFTRFQHIRSKTDLRSNEELEILAMDVMIKFDDVVTHLDRYDYVIDLLRNVGASHRKHIKNAPKLLLIARQPFLDAVQITLGDRYSDNIQNIYGILIDFVIQVMIDGLKGECRKLSHTNVY